MTMIMTSLRGVSKAGPLSINFVQPPPCSECGECDDEDEDMQIMMGIIMGTLRLQESFASVLKKFIELTVL